MNRGPLIAALCAVVLGGVAATPVAATPPPIPRLDWTACPADPALDCAEIQVPVDYRHPRGESTTLQLTRAKAAGPRIGVLISPPGQFAAALSERLRSRFDVVSYTNRALGAATGSCRKPTDVVFFPSNEDEFRYLRTTNREVFTRCAQDYGPLWHRLDSLSEAQDVDLVRAALGEQQISLLSTVSGEIVGQLYAERFPHRLRALVLEGEADHSMPDAAAYLSAHARAAQDTMGAFADWCSRNVTCGMHGLDVRKFYDGVRAETEQDQFFDLRGYPIDLPALAAGPESFLSYPMQFGWLDMGWHFRDIYDRGTQSLGPLRPEQASRSQQRVAVQNAEPFAGPSPAMCSDWNFAINSYRDLQRVREAMTKAAPLTRMSGLQWNAVVGCVGWPFGTANPPHKLRINQPVAALVVGSAFNPSQLAGWSDSLARQIPGAKSLRYEGPGVSAYFSSPCASEAIDTFLITGKAPTAPSCPAIWP